MSISKSTYLYLFTLTAFVYFLGLFFPLIDPDANEYACVAMRMAQRNDFLNIISRNLGSAQEYDYLDKPHLLFWLSAISFKIFGISHWAYRLPSILFTALGAFSTYRLGKLLYNSEVGRNAALMFVTSLAIILFNHDVRTDTILVGATIFGIWQLAAFVEKEKLINVILGGVGIALGVATKGMISMMLAGVAIFCHIAYRRKWHLFYSWKWLLGLLGFAVAISPVLYCYYHQFDMHPEKVVNGATGTSGIKFLFWTQSFERVAGNRSFVSSPEYSFFYHTILWAILPWSLLLYSSVFGRFKYLWDTRFRPVRNAELLTLGGAFILFQVMSASKFKLPHYLNILFPLFTVLLASYLDNLYQAGKLKILNAFRKVQYFVIAIMVIGAMLVNTWFFPVNSVWVILGAVLFLAGLIYILRQKPGILYQIIVPSAVGILFLAYMLNTNFYPKLMKYQSGNSIADIAKQHNIPSSQISAFRHFTFSLDFYLQQSTPVIDVDQVKAKAAGNEPFYLVVYSKERPAFDSLNIKPIRTFETPDFHVSRLDIEFLNPNTRMQAIDTAYLMQIK